MSSDGVDMFSGKMSNMASGEKRTKNTTKNCFDAYEDTNQKAKKSKEENVAEAYAENQNININNELASEIAKLSTNILNNFSTNNKSDSILGEINSVAIIISSIKIQKQYLSKKIQT